MLQKKTVSTIAQLDHNSKTINPDNLYLDQLRDNVITQLIQYAQAEKKRQVKLNIHNMSEIDELIKVAAKIYHHSFINPIQKKH